MRGLAAVAVLAAGAAGAAEPSFECTRADGAIETMICADAGLAALDREAARLLARVPSDAEVAARQTDWLRTRTACAEVRDARACIVATYLARIRDLRAAHPAARGADAFGISSGPFPVDCGNAAPLAVTFVNDTPPHALLEGDGAARVFARTPAASGVRYQAVTDAGVATFWVNGDAATLDRPGAAPRRCTIGDG